MKNRVIISLLLGVLCMVGNRPVQGTDVYIVHGEAEDEPLHRHAARELGRYVHLMTGATPRILGDGEPIQPGIDDVVFLLGDSGANRRTAALVAEADITFVVDSIIPDHGDAFIIRSYQEKTYRNARNPGVYGQLAVPAGPQHVVIAGRRPVATLYGVYHYLDYACGVGFFEDGERVPELETLPVTDLIMIEKPVFAERIQFPWDPRCLLAKSVSTLWRADVEWTAYLDFLVKNKQNWMRFDTQNRSRIGYGLWHKTYPETTRGKPGEFLPPWWPPEFVFGNTKKVIDMARLRGIHLWGDAFNFGILTRDAQIIKERYPNADLSKPDPYYPMSSHIQDQETLVAFYEHNLKELIKHYGKPDMYWTSFPPEEEEASYEHGTVFKASRANFMVSIVKKHDPEARFLVDSWLLAMRFRDRPEGVRELMDGLDFNYIFNSSYPGRDPIYRRFNYFHGLPWHYTEIEAFGGTDHFALNIPYPELLARAKDIATNPKSNCIGFGNIPELIGRDPMLRYVYLRLSWDPFRYETWHELLAEYTMRRYGGDAFSNMYRSGDLLTKALFHTADREITLEHGNLPVYRYDTYMAYSKVAENWDQYADWTAFDLLVRALYAALEENGQFEGDELYEKYLAGLFHALANTAYEFALARVNSAYGRATTLFAAQVREGPDVKRLNTAFEEEAIKMDIALGEIEKVWSTRPELSTANNIETAMSVEGADPALIKTIRLDSLTFEEGAYETMAQFYRPRSALIVDDLRRRLARRETKLFDGEITKDGTTNA